MNASILSSDRYIAIKTNGSLTFNKTLRVLTKGKDGKEICLPCRWNDKTQRLESVSIDEHKDFVPFMYCQGRKLENSLARAGLNYEFLTLEQAKTLTV